MKLQIIDLTGADDALVHSVLSALPQAERMRILRCRAPADRARSALAQAALRTALARTLGIPPAAIDLARDAHGKPTLPGAPLHLSISHSGDFAVCALDSHPLGVDVERMRQRDVQRLAMGCFSARENAQIAASPSAKRAFYRLWTQKESTVKTLGTGLCDLRNVEIVADTPLLRGKALPWRVRAFELRAGRQHLYPYLFLPKEEGLYALGLCQSVCTRREIDVRFATAQEVAQIFLKLAHRSEGAKTPCAALHRACGSLPNGQRFPV